MFDSLRKIFVLFSPQERRKAYWIFVAMLIMALLDVIGVASIMPFMAIVSNPDSLQQHPKLLTFYQVFQFTSTREFLLFLGFMVLGVLLVGNSYTIFTTWLITRFAAMRNYSLSTRLLAKYLAQPYSFFLNQNTSNLSSNILTEVSSVINGTFMPALQMIAKMIVTTLMLTLLFWINYILAITSIIFLGGAYSAIFLLARRKLKEISEAQVQNNQKRYKIISEALGGIKDIKLLDREKTFLDLYSVPAHQFAEHSAIWNTVALIPRYALETIAFGGVLLIVIYFLMTNQNMAEVMPLIALYAFACFRLMPALQNIFASLTSMRAHKGALDVIYNALGAYKDSARLETGKQRNTLLPMNSEIKLMNLSFSYDNSKCSVIDGLNLNIRAKTTVGFVGVTGSGKTTTVDIILGLLRPAEGSLVIDDIRIDEHNIHAWQKKLGYVSQSIYLADDTAAKNIAFGIPVDKVDIEAVIRAAKIANIHDFVINELSQGYETILGERGVRLSGGQRQRIGIARALYHDPEVLVLDEATSSLDGMTENVVMDAVHSLSRKKTIIIIAHRLTTVKNCDQIYLFEKGKIIKSGDYASLIESDGYFKKIANLT